MKQRRVFWLLLALTLFLPLSSGSALPSPASQPQTVLPLTSLTGEEYSPDLVYDRDLDAYLLAYGHYSEGGEVFYHTIEAQFIASDGGPFYSNLLLSGFTPQPKDHPAVAYNTATYQFLVVWDHQVEDDNHDIYGRIVSDGGAALGSPVQIETSTFDDSLPDLVYNPVSGEYLAVWERYQTDQSEIYAQRLDGTTGAPIPGGGFYVADDSIDESGAAVAVDSATGDYLVAWHQQEEVGNYDLYAQRVSQAGALTGSPIPISTALGDQLHPALASRPDYGQYLVVWQDGRVDGDIYARRLDATGTPVGSEFAVAELGSLYRHAPQVAYSESADDFMVTWWVNAGGENLDVYRRRVSRDGTLPEGEILVSGESTLERDPVIAAGGTLSYLLAWTDSRDAAEGLNIYGDVFRLNRLQGKVFAGLEGDESTPLDGATVSLYGSDTSGVQGDLLESMQSAWGGWFALIVPQGYSFYSLVETNPGGYESVAASSMDGTVLSPDWIEYAAPLEEKEQRGNRFWDISVSESLPDLVITDLWPEGEQVCFQVMNRGLAQAPAGHYASLVIDTSQEETLQITDVLAPGQRLNDCFLYNFSCEATSLAVDVYADSTALVAETDDDNNNRLENWRCDTTPPMITIAARAIPQSPSTVVIRWTTDEASDSRVRYDSRAGMLEQEGYSASLLTNHQIILNGLEASTAYHYQVESQDVSGNRVVSPLDLFLTPAQPDGSDPSIELGGGPLECSGVFTFTATASDGALRSEAPQTTGIDRIDFSIDGALAYQKYSPPYELALDCSALDNGPHEVTGLAYDKAGNSASDHVDFSVAAPVDLTAPQVQITSPVTDQVLFGKKAMINASLSDDVGLKLVHISLDGLFLEVTPIANSPKTLNFSTTFDTTLLENGKHRLHFNVLDTDYKSTQAYVDFIVTNEAPPDLVLTSHTASRTGNFFTVSVTVENVGSGTAYNLEVLDTLHALQPISSTVDTQTHSASHIPASHDFAISIHDILPLAPGGTRTFTYQAAPVMIDALNSKNVPPVSIGETLSLEYRTQAGDKLYKPGKSMIATVTDGDLLSEAYKKALKQADYLIATNPQRLFWHYIGNDVDTLLANMARLAVRRNGALGYSEYYDPEELDRQVKSLKGYNCGPYGCTTWAAQLASAFQQPLGGALLIVGETEIMPTYAPQEGFSINWGPARISDHPFADTGGSPQPDLIVGRLIGDTAALLNKQLVASLGVHDQLPGHQFSRNKAWLFGSYGLGSFIKDVEDAAVTLAGKFPVIQKQQWKKYFTAASFSHSLDAGDGLALGWFGGAAFKRIVLADLSADQIKILQTNGTVDLTMTQSLDIDDMIVTGKFLGNVSDEILAADVSADLVHVWVYPNIHLGSFALTIDAGDRIAAADVVGDAKAELVFADHSANQVYAISINGAPPLVGTVQATLNVEFDDGDMLAVCDVYDVGDPRVVIGDLSPLKDDNNPGKIWIKRFNSTETQEISPKDKSLLPGDMLTCGKLHNTDLLDRIVLGNAATRVWYYGWDNASGGFIEGNIPMALDTELQKYAGFAAGNVLQYAGYYQDELVVADWYRDQVLVLDAGAHTGRMIADLPNYTPETDFILWAGHGNVDLWEDIQSRNLTQGVFPMDFEQHHPVIFATSCLTGNYQEGNLQQETHNIAETFMDSGAAVYIGATESSHGGEDIVASQLFFKNWTAGNTVGQILTEVERNLWHGNPSDDWWWWVWEYNLYGDPLFGADTSEAALSARHTSQPASQAPASLEVVVPDYVLEEGYYEGGFDRVTIPGGQLWDVAGDTMLPYYTYNLDYPAGTVITGVTQLSRSPAQTAEGIDLPVAPAVTPTCGCQPVAQPGGGEGWFPEKEFEWAALSNPDGTTSLSITVYPFDYNPQTAQARFYKTYTFAVQSRTPGLELLSLAPEKPVYTIGDLVKLDLQLENSGEPRDLSAQLTLRRYTTGELIAGLPIQTLTDVQGKAGLRFIWDNSGQEPGIVLAQLEVRDVDDQLLGELTTTFSLGLSSARTLALTAEPGYFAPGDALALSLEMDNDGTLPLSGSAVIRVLDALGQEVFVFMQDYSDLDPGEGLSFDTSWDTSGVARGNYTVVGLVYYPGGGTDALTQLVSTEKWLYLPLAEKK